MFIEINAHPARLDLDWRYMKTAKEIGAMFVINPDAHHTSEVAYYEYGVGIARKGWLEKEDVFNTLPRADVVKAFKTARKNRP